MVVGPPAVLVLAGWFATWNGPDRTDGALDAAWTLLTAAPWALAWLAAAVGYGRPVRRLLSVEGGDAWAVQAGVGVALLLTVDAALGTTGVLAWGGSGGAWAVVLPGVVLLAGQLARRPPRSIPAAPWPAWAAAPAIAVLIVATASAPGWLWSTEFGGYDALSYHLQLPREWLEAGRIQPFEHNVYSFLPGYLEAGYFHLALLVGDGVGSAIACQVLHACLTLLAAFVVARLAGRMAGRCAAGVAAAVMLGTPWVIVVGSLAYNEMAVAVLLATGLLVFELEPGSVRARGVVIGLLAAAACGAKLTATGFVAAPLGLLLVITSRPGRRGRQIGSAVAVGLAVLSPYLVRNWIHAGNPLFPFATGILGLGPWTAEQAAIWTEGHAAVGGRLAGLWNQFLRFGMGPAPNLSEPWVPQWSVLPWLALLVTAVGLATPALRPRVWRPALVLATQVVFWLAMTHVRSRFMLPSVVPAAALVGAGAAVVVALPGSQTSRNLATTGVVIALLGWCVVPVAVFVSERGGAPSAMIGWVPVLTGEGLSPQQRQALGEKVPAVYLNDRAFADRSTLLVGEARPFYFLNDVAYQTTWDRGPLSDVMRNDPESPQRWVAALRALGFTHVLINVEMLQRWADRGWNDPLITADRVLEIGDHAELERDFGSGVLLYRLD